MVLRYQLCTYWQLHARLGACYCVPPIGGFVTHQSGCDPKRGRILHMFDEEWAQEGTRPFARWHKHRALCHFSLRGLVQQLLQIVLPRYTAVYRWITQAPPAVEEPVALRPLEKGLAKSSLPFHRAVAHEDDEQLEHTARRARARRGTCSCMGCEASPQRRYFGSNVGMCSSGRVSDVRMNMLPGFTPPNFTTNSLFILSARSL